MADKAELKRQIVKAIYEAWDHYADKKQMMGSPEASRIADYILERFDVAAPLARP